MAHSPQPEPGSLLSLRGTIHCLSFLKAGGIITRAAANSYETNVSDKARYGKCLPTHLKLLNKHWVTVKNIFSVVFSLSSTCKRQCYPDGVLCDSKYEQFLFQYFCTHQFISRKIINISVYFSTTQLLSLNTDFMAILCYLEYGLPINFHFFSF